MFEEFIGISNHEAYKKVFSDRMMLPYPSDPKRLLGNTQREDFLPSLLPLIGKLAPNAEIFDIGAGAGEIIDLALYQAPHSTINIEEPNPFLINRYRECLEKYPNLELGFVYEGYAQDLYNNSIRDTNARPSVDINDNSQDLILALQMIYHVTPYAESDFNPDKEIIDLISFLYQKLKPGSSIFLVYSDDETATTAKASEWYLGQKNQNQKLEQLHQIHRARTQLLKNGGIQTVLAHKFPRQAPKISLARTDSWIYGKTKEDMAILCLLSDDDPANQQPFDREKLFHFTDFIEQNGDDIQLGIETRQRAQQGMYRFYQGQIILILEKPA